jgi:hypothetical protein
MSLNVNLVKFPACPPSIRALGLIAVGMGAAAVAGIGGCSDVDPISNAALTPVKGKVLLGDGKPLSSGRVAFVSPEKGMEFTGPVGADGSFSLSHGEKEGIPEGKYIVRIDPEASRGAAKDKPTKRSGALPFPEKYADETTSGLTVTVKPGQNELEPFTLGK